MQLSRTIVIPARVFYSSIFSWKNQASCSRTVSVRSFVTHTMERNVNDGLVLDWFVHVAVGRLLAKAVNQVSQPPIGPSSHDGFWLV